MYITGADLDPEHCLGYKHEKLKILLLSRTIGTSTLVLVRHTVCTDTFGLSRLRSGWFGP